MSDTEHLMVNGTRVTDRTLAQERQRLAHDSAFNIDFIPPWDQLSEHEQHMAVLDARNYLRALGRIAA
jgi:hypothetical protein